MMVAAKMNESEDRAALKALIDHELTVALQPIQALGSGEIYSFEALSRSWEIGGFRDPHALFDEAARLGLLDYLELRQAVRALEKMVERFAPPRPQLFINLDLRLLHLDGAFFDDLEAAMRRLGVPHGDLLIELSERQEKTNIDAMRQTITALRKRGFRFALDDFGAGVSDILALYHFDVDVLKLDRFLINGLAQDEKKRLFVARLVELAHFLGQTVVAEGVETAADLAACEELQCDLAQGFHLGRPSATPAAAPRAAARPKPRKASMPDLRAIADRPPAFEKTASARTIIEDLRRDAKGVCYPVVDERDRPVGVVSGAAVSAFLAAPFAHALLRNPGFQLEVGELATPCPIVDVDVDLARLSQMLAGAAAENVIVTEEMRYFGVISAASLLNHFQQMQLRDALDKNPLSGLPGNLAIDRFVAHAATVDENRWFAHFDFNDFKPFNDAYGFRAGDRAIKLFADILQTTFASGDVFLGHVGGDDFFAGGVGGGLEAVPLLVDQALDAFQERARQLYNPADRARGRIRTRDRNGDAAEIELLSCCAALLLVEQGASLRSPEGAMLEMAELKRAAKAQRGMASAWRRAAWRRGVAAS